MSNKITDILPYTKPMRILYIEDNDDTRRFTLELLSHFFENISVSENGKDGLGLFKKDKFDLIITDVNMPVMDGIKMSGFIREIDVDIPIIILSAHHELSLHKTASNLNITEYLLKPLSLMKLIEALQKINQGIDMRDTVI